MAFNKVKLNIAGSDYVVSSEEEHAYMAELGAQVDRSMRELMDSSNRISTTMAAVLTALNNADLARKAEASADNLRGQMKGFLDDSHRSRTEAEAARRELEQLRRENAALKARLGE